MKCVLSIVCCIIQVFSIGEFCKVKSFSNVLSDVCYVNIYRNGKVERLASDNEYFIDTISQVKQLFNNTREMPAFGVALHSDVVESLKSGVWLEFVYEQPNEFNEMIFEKLLFNVNKEDLGFNVMRFNHGEYGGRCFYFDIINNDMYFLNDYILSVK